MRLSEFIERSNRAQSAPELFALIERAGRDLGFDRVAYGALVRHGLFQPTACPPPAIALNYPSDWQAHYFARRYQDIDPIVLYSAGLELPFLWDSLPDIVTLDARQQAFMAEAWEAGLRDGVSIPLHGPLGSICVVCFASSSGGIDARANLSLLHVLAVQFHMAYIETLGITAYPRPPALLSRRERECLVWIARGKSSWDIGKILAISENTVNFHVKNALRKLGARNRTLAALKAIRLGLIQP